MDDGGRSSEHQAMNVEEEEEDDVQNSDRTSLPAKSGEGGSSLWCGGKVALPRVHPERPEHGPAAEWFRDRILNHTKSTRDLAVSTAAREVQSSDVHETGRVASEKLSSVMSEYVDTSSLCVRVVSDDESGFCMLDALMESTTVTQGEYERTVKRENMFDESHAAQAVLTLSLDEKFEESVDWSAEGDRDVKWCAGKRSPPPFLFNISAGTGGADDVRSFPIRIAHGMVPELVVSFKQAHQVPDAAKTNRSLRALLGSKVAFRGRGVNVELDRIFVREKMTEVSEKYGACVQMLSLRYPASLVRGDREISMMVGNTAAPSWKQLSTSLKVPDLLLCVSCERSRLSRKMEGALRESGLLPRLFRENATTRLVYAVNQEDRAAPLDTTASSLAEMRTRSFPELADDLRQFMLQCSPYPTAAGLSDRVSHMLSEVVAVAPAQFVALSHAALPEGRKTSLRRATNMPRIMSIFANAALSACASTIETLSSDWQRAMTSREDGDGNGNCGTRRPQVLARAAGANSASSLMEQMRPEMQLNRVFQEKFAEMQTRVRDATQRLEYVLCAKAREAYDDAVREWPAFRDRHMPSAQACRLLLSPSSNGVCLGADLSQFMCRALLRGVSSEWASIVPQMLADIQLLVTSLAKNVLRHVSAAVAGKIRFPDGSSDIERACTKKLIDLSRALEARVQRYMNHAMSLIQNTHVESIGLEACREALGVVVLSKSSALPPYLNRYHELVEDGLPDVPTRAMRIMHRAVSAPLLDIQNIVSSMEREVQETGKAALHVLVMTQQQQRQHREKATLVGGRGRDLPLALAGGGGGAAKTPSFVAPGASARTVRTGGSTPSKGPSKGGGLFSTAASFAASMGSAWASAMKAGSSVAGGAAGGAAVASSTTSDNGDGHGRQRMQMGERRDSGAPRHRDAVKDAMEVESSARAETAPKAATLGFTPRLLHPDAWNVGDAANHARFLEHVASIGGSTKLMERAMMGMGSTDPVSQFKSIAMAVYGSTESHPVVRLLVSQEIAAHPRLYAPFLARFRGSFDEYVHDVSAGDRPGDHVTLYAASNFYRQPVLVLSPIFTSPMRINPAPGLEDRSATTHDGRPIAMALTAPNHYCPILSAVGEERPSTVGEKRALEEDEEVAEVERGIDRMQVSGDDGSLYHHMRKRRRMRVGEDGRIPTEPLPEAQVPDGAYDPMDVSGVLCLPTKVVRSPNSTVSASGVRNPVSLKSLCVRTLSCLPHLLPPFQGFVPDELVQELLTSYVRSHAVSDSLLKTMLAGSRIRSLSLAGCVELSYAACVELAEHVECLQRLDLSECAATPSEGIQLIVSAARSLEHVVLRGCHQLKDAAVAAMAEHNVKLTYVDLGECVHVTDRGVRRIAMMCKSLSSLYLRGCVLLSAAALRGLPVSLTELDVRDCRNVSAHALPGMLSDNRSLTRLLLSTAGDVSEDAMRGIKQLSKLRELELGFAQWGENARSVLSSIGSDCLQLEVLRLRGCRSDVTQLFTVPPAFNGPSWRRPRAPFESLGVLDLSRGVHVNDDLLARVGLACKNLREVDVSHCDVSDIGIERMVEHIPCLRALRANKCNNVGNGALLAVGRHCPRLTELTLFGCAMVSDVGVHAIAKQCRDLQHLEVSACEHVTDTALEELAKRCSAIHTLGLEGLPVTDGGLTRLIAANPGLVSLNVSCCKITNASIALLAERCSRVERLNIAHCFQVHPDTVRTAVARWPRLRELNLRGGLEWKSFTVEHPNLRTLNMSWCSNLDDDAVGNIVSGCPSLVALDLSWCGKLTMRSMYQLMQHSPPLRSLSIRGCTRIPPLSASKAFSGTTLRIAQE